MTQPEALRLADELERGSYDAQMARTMVRAAAELRRLSAENEALRAALEAVRFQCEADARAGEWVTSIAKLLDAIKAVEEGK